MNFWNPRNRKESGDDRSPGRRVTKRQLLIRLGFYVVLFTALIWWLRS